MNFREEYKIDSDSFPSFFNQYKDSAKTEENITKADSKSTNNADFEVKSLKEKIKSMELDKKLLENELKDINTRFNKEKQAFEGQIKELKLLEKKSQEEISKIKEESSKYKKKNQESIDKISFLESKLEFLTKENKRITEQYTIDKEN